MDNALVLNVAELSQKLKISKCTAYELVKSPGFPKVQLGKRILIPIDELQAWLSKQTRT